MSSFPDLLRKFLLRLRGNQFTSPRVIHFYFNTAARLAWFNHLRYRCFPSMAWKKPTRRLHLGSGPRYLADFLNVELLPVWPSDLWLDVRDGLPFPDDTIDSIYSNQMLEHLPLRDVIRLLKECHRVLRPGGKVRFIVPSIERALTAYQRGDYPWFFSEDKQHRSLGSAVNDYLLCQNHHLVLFDAGFFTELLNEAGSWQAIHEPAPDTSEVLTDAERHLSEGHYPGIQNHLLVIEATKG